MQLSVRDAAQLLHVSEKTVYRWIHKEDLPHHRVNEQYRFNRVELLQWATENRLKVAADIFQEPENGNGAPLKLSDALFNGGIFYNLSGNDKKSVLKAVVETMPLPHEVDREFLLYVMLAREELGSTGIGDGIAIPHARNPIVLHVKKPSVSLCFLEKPIDFQALDGKPVSILFTLLSPSVRAHLNLLAKLSYALRDEKLLAVLKAPGSSEQILAEIRRIEDALPQPQALHAEGAQSE